MCEMMMMLGEAVGDELTTIDLFAVVEGAD